MTTVVVNSYRLLDDELILRETIWLISLHLEHFDCKDNTLPCGVCRLTAAKLAPFFLLGIEAIADSTGNHAKGLAKIALDKLSSQRWSVTRPWKSFSVPVPRGEMCQVPVIQKTIFEEEQEKKTVTYRLVKRHKDAL